MISPITGRCNSKMQPEIVQTKLPQSSAKLCIRAWLSAAARKIVRQLLPSCQQISKDPLPLIVRGFD